MKTLAQLIELYYQSVGRGANLLLNVPPNRDGLLGAEDIVSLKAFGDWRRKTFGKAAVSAAGPDIDAARPVTFSVIRLREDIRQGQRIESVVVEAWRDGWQAIGSATSVGPRRLIRLETPVTTARVRARSTGGPVSELALF